jgi:solute carrier family 25 oxoglutarate transporter 11
MALNLGMLAPYDYSKGFISPYLGEGRLTNVTASAIAGFLASFISLPFDYMKTKIMKQKPLADGLLPYKSITDAFRKTI